jgi:hypothetical protein
MTAREENPWPPTGINLSAYKDLAVAADTSDGEPVEWVRAWCASPRTSRARRPRSAQALNTQTAKLE